jgi:transposase-like protein
MVILLFISGFLQEEYMARKRLTAEEIIGRLRQAEVLLAQGRDLDVVLREIGATKNTFYRWRKEYGGMKLDQARRLKDLETENMRLKRAVAELTIDNQILKEVSRGKF